MIRRESKPQLLMIALALFAAVCILSPSVILAETLKFAVTDVEGLEELQRDFGAFKTILSEKIGMEVEFFPVTSRTLAVEALRSKRVDVVLTGPSEYVVIRKKTGAEPVVRFSRPDYFSAVVVKADSGIEQPEDLKGKRIAFGDVGSTAYHLGPMWLLKQAGIDPAKDLQVMHVAKKVGWEALKRGDVAALGIKHSQFLAFRDAEEGIEPAAFRVILRGPDLPDDVLVAGTHVPPEKKELIKKTFTENSDTIVNAILKGDGNQKYKGMKFLARVQDSDYNIVRDMYSMIGYDEFARP